jgi:hypothetical protein
MKMIDKRLTYTLALLAGLGIGLAASGCLSSAVTCTSNLKACGTICADVTTDKDNCGGCGIACQVGQVCQDSQCVCEPGATFCNGACVNTNTDPNDCGGCAGEGGSVCGSEQVCEGGQCKQACTLGGTPTVCGQSCADLQNDPDNCGACGHACASGQSCESGTCGFDAVGACLNGGEVVGLSVARRSGGTTAVGTEPGLLAVSGSTVLVADAVDGTLRQVDRDSLAQLPPTNLIGDDPQGLLVEGANVYALSGSGNALTVFSQTPTDAGITLSDVGGYAFPGSSNPHGLAQLGSELYVPQFGCCIGFGGCSDPSGGNFLARLDVLDPTQPRDAGVIDLSGLSFDTFDGGTSYARPGAVAAVDGKIYVTVGNLDGACGVAGPGFLAQFDPADGGLSQIALPDNCKSPFALATSGNDLVVSCSGNTVFGGPPDYLPVSTTDSSLVLVRGGQPIATYQPACPTPANGCSDPALGRVAARDGVLFATDQVQGRVFVVAIDGGSFTELHGYQTDGPIVACKNADGGSLGQLVQDVVALP